MMPLTRSARRLVMAMLLTSFFALFVVGVPSMLLGQDEGDAAAPELPEEDISALDLYQQGGVFMHILLVCSIGTIAVAVYCFVQVSRKKMAPQDMVDRVNSYMVQRDVGSAYNVCEASPSSYAKVVSAALLKVNFERDLANKASMMDAAAEALDEEEHRQMVWINYLKLFFTFPKTFSRPPMRAL